jgi:hypothetical protein
VKYFIHGFNDQKCTTTKQNQTSSRDWNRSKHKKWIGHLVIKLMVESKRFARQAQDQTDKNARVSDPSYWGYTRR